MTRFLLIRLVQTVITLLLVVTLVFFSARITGSPVDVMVPIEATPEEREYITELFGLDQPLAVQYVRYLGSVVKGELGLSFYYREPVSHLIGETLPNSVSLATVALFLSLLFSLPLGVYAAVRRDTWVDYIARGISVAGMAIPSFWLALVLILVFSVFLGWLPSGRMAGPLSFVLPALSMAFVVMAGFTRLTYSGMIKALDDDYILLARVKSLPERIIIWKHAFRNALIPVVTYAGYLFALLIGAAVVTETIFAWPGIGRLGYEALVARDFPTLQGVVLTMSALTLVMNLLVDILYAYIDPRIRY